MFSFKNKVKQKSYAGQNSYHDKIEQHNPSKTGTEIQTKQSCHKFYEKVCKNLKTKLKIKQYLKGFK